MLFCRHKYEVIGEIKVETCKSNSEKTERSEEYYKYVSRCTKFGKIRTDDTK